MNRLRQQRGVALPVMLIILTVMLIGSLYLLKSSTSSTALASNLAYDSAQARAADLGLMQGFEWLKETAASNKTALKSHNAGNGYRATLDTSQDVNNSGFWSGSVTITQGEDGSPYQSRIEYVIHRMCALEGAYDGTNNKCMQTVSPIAGGGAVAAGTSLAMNSIVLTKAPEVHYVITARIFGARGGNVVNQMVVMIGA